MIDIVRPIITEISRIGDLAYEKYRSDLSISMKDDNTPVTNVDKIIHEEMLNVLTHFFPDVPVISEEGAIPEFQKRQNMDKFWLLDPLDGTLEFINETDEFVISLGYISQKEPTMGILHHPVSGTTWIAIKECGVFIQHHGGEIKPLDLNRNLDQDTYTILVSSRRNDEDLTTVIARQREKEYNQTVTIKPIGSALKFGYLVDGRGDEYLRFTPMKEWDFAAGHCIAKEAGFEITPLDQTSSVQYATEDMLIPPLSIRRKKR